MKKTAVIAALCGAAFATSAAAQDNANPHDGFRVEVIGGYDNIDLEVEGEGSGDEGDLMYGVAVGYDFGPGNSPVTFGIEAEYSDSSVGVSEDFVGVIEGFNVDATGALEAGRDLYLGGRLGGALSDNVLVYAKAGYTNMQIELNVDGTIDGEAFAGSESATFDGLRLGAGAEFAFGSNAFAKVEYRYSTYSDGEFEFDGVTYDLGTLFDGADLTRNQFIAGVGFRF